MALFTCVVQYIFVTYFIHNSLYLLIPYVCFAPSPSHLRTGIHWKWKWKLLFVTPLSIHIVHGIL